MFHPSQADSVQEAAQRPDSIDVTVAIPTYNGNDRLPAVLEKLRAQSETDSITWEVIVSDNNSQDQTPEIVRQYQQQWPQHIPLRYVFAAEQGAAFARQRAVETARGRLIGFLDDDNLPTETWVKSIYDFAQMHPRAGAFGSQIHGDFESPLPEELEPLACFLAIVERGDKPHLYEPSKKMFPPGAGLAVRRKAWIDNVPKSLFLNHKGKKAGLASEDLEAVIHIQKAGWEIWYNPEMVVYHRIPDVRLQADYMRSLLRCVGLSRFYVRMLGLKEWQRPLMVPAYLFNDLRELVLHRLKARNSPQNIASLCRQEHLTSTLQSPFFVARKALQDSAETFWRGGTDQHKAILRHIEKGFEAEQFQLYQQPVFGRTTSPQPLLHAEILLRLQTSQSSRELLFPRKFMPVAEIYGLTKTIDYWVLRHLIASAQSEESEPSESRHRSCRYSINLSAATVRDQKFLDFLADLLASKRFPADLLSFEISEQVIKNNLEAAVRFSHCLKSIGCQLVLDDFQSAQALANFPLETLDCIKVNLSAGSSGRRLKRLKALQDEIDSVTKIPIAYVAKGIESAEAKDLAVNQNILFMQGYSISKPAPLIPVELGDR